MTKKHVRGVKTVILINYGFKVTMSSSHNILQNVAIADNLYKHYAHISH